MFKLIFFATTLVLSSSNQDILEQILEKLDHQQKQIDYLRSIISNQAKQTVKDNVAARKTEVPKSMPVPETPIYFSVATNAAIDLTADGIVVYNDIVLNVGDLYASDGRFTCPVGGYYYFHVSVKSDALSVAQVNLVRDDGTNRTTLASAMSVDGYDHASNGGYFECSAGTTVYVAAGPSAGRIYGEAGYRYNTFSGGLLWVIQ